MIIMGAGICQWFHGDATYRAVLALLMLTGSMGRNGGGWAHYVGQEKCRPVTGWATMAMATDWPRPPRQMIGTAYWYTHTDQWRYDGYRADALTSPLAQRPPRGMHTIDTIALSARLGWMPSYPQFDRNPLDLADEIAAEPADEAPATHVVASSCGTAACGSPSRTRTRRRTGRACLTLWRANLLGSSAKGDEYFLRHLLGTHDNLQAEQTPPDRRPRDVTWRDGEPPRGQARPAAVAGLPDDQLDPALRRRAARRHLVREARPQHHRHAPVRARLQPRDRPAVRDPHRLRRLPRDRPPVLRAGPHPPRACAATSSPCRCSTTRPARPRSPAAGCSTGGPGSATPSRAGRCRASSSSSATTPAVADKMASIGPLIDRLGMTTKAVTYQPDEEVALPRREERRDARRRGRRAARRIDTDAKMAEAILALSGTTNGRLAVAGLPQAGAAHRHAARRPRRGQRGEADHLRRHPGPAGAGDHQPGVVGQRDRRPPLRPVHRQRRAAQAVAHPHRPHALPARPRLDARDRRGAADLPRRRWTCTGCSASRGSATTDGGDRSPCAT